MQIFKEIQGTWINFKDTGIQCFLNSGDIYAIFILGIWDIFQKKGGGGYGILGPPLPGPSLINNENSNFGSRAVPNLTSLHLQQLAN